MFITLILNKISKEKDFLRPVTNCNVISRKSSPFIKCLRSFSIQLRMGFMILTLWRTRCLAWILEDQLLLLMLDEVGVGDEVPLQIPFLREALSAQVAHERLISRVRA